MAGNSAHDLGLLKGCGKAKIKGSAQQIKLLLQKANALGEQAAQEERERTRLQRQVLCLEEMIHRGGLWLASIPEVQRLALGEKVESHPSTTGSGPSTPFDEDMTEASTGVQQASLAPEEVSPGGSVASLVCSLDASSDYMANILRGLTPEFAEARSGWTWQQWNTQYAEFCKAASFLLTQLDSPVTIPEVREQLDQAVTAISLDICCLVMYYAETMIQCNTRNCSTGAHEAAPTELWEHVASKLQLNREARQKLAAGYESYSKVQAAERTPLLQQLDVYSQKTEASDAGSSAVLSELLDALEHNMKRSQQAGISVAYLIWSTLTKEQMAVALVSSFPFWIAAVPCKYLRLCSLGVTLGISSALQWLTLLFYTSTFSVTILLWVRHTGVGVLLHEFIL